MRKTFSLVKDIAITVLISILIINNINTKEVAPNEVIDINTNTLLESKLNIPPTKKLYRVDGVSDSYVFLTSIDFNMDNDLVLDIIDILENENYNVGMVDVGDLLEIEFDNSSEEIISMEYTDLYGTNL